MKKIIWTIFWGLVVFKAVAQIQVTQQSLTWNNGSSVLLNNPRSVFVLGNYAYIASEAGGSLQILDVSNPISPSPKGSIVDGSGGALLSGACAVYVSGTYAFVAASGSNALEIIDVSNPAVPVHKGSISNGSGGALLNYPRGVFVSGNYAYVASASSNALEIIDISNPSTPTHKGSITNGSGGASLYSAWSVFVSGNHAYVASSSALEVVDVSNPAAPVHSGSITNGSGGALLNIARSVFVSGNYAYVASLSSNALEIVDISNPAAPTHKSSIVNGAGGAMLNAPLSVFVSNGYAFVASANSNALEIIDVSNVANPVHATSLPDGYNGVYMFGPQSVVVQGGYVYVATYGGGSLEILRFTINQTISLGSLSNKTYGDAPFTLNASVNSGLPISYSSSNSSVAITSGSTVTIVGAGTTVITASQPGNSIYNAASPVSQNLTVNKSTLTVTANNQSRAYGAANPALTLSYSGFIGNDNSFSLSPQPTAATSATNTSSVGSYAIVPSGGGSSNYNFVYNNGTLTVIAVPNAPTGNNVTACYDGALHTGSASAGSGQSIVWYTALSGGSATGAPSGTAAGTYEAYAAARDNVTGYESSTRTLVTVTINPTTAITSQPPTGNQTFCINGTQPTLSVSATGSSLNYQWFTSNGTPISGGTSSTYSPSTASAGTSQFYVTVYGACGNSTSNVTGAIVVLPVVKAVINANPSDLNICTTGGVALTASNFYTDPPTTYNYSWSDGETTQTITPGVVGTFTVTVSGQCGTSTSTVTTVRVPRNCSLARIGMDPTQGATETNSEGPDVTEVTASPNPANDEATIAVPNVEKVDREVLVYDLLGKIAGSVTIKKGEWKTSFSTKEMAEALYIINVGYGDRVNTTKMMVMHK